MGGTAKRERRQAIQRCLLVGDGTCHECFNFLSTFLVPATNVSLDPVNLSDQESCLRAQDYWERDFMHSYWGAEKYPKLLAVKDKYDPEGLFVCRHCVGSERWTEESEFNCRNETMWE